MKNKLQIFHQNSFSLLESSSLLSPLIFSEEAASVSSMAQNMMPNHQQTQKIKKKRNLPGNPGIYLHSAPTPTLFFRNRRNLCAPQLFC